MSIAGFDIAEKTSITLDIWRVAHRAAVAHLIQASWSDCGCTAQRLCAEGQEIEDRVASAERALMWQVAR